MRRNRVFTGRMSLFARAATPVRGGCDRRRRARAAGVRRAASGGDYGGKAPDYAKALAGAPKPLASSTTRPTSSCPAAPTHSSSGSAELRGHPVVVNKWASWCGPCREEFPWLQRQAAEARQAGRLHRGGLERLGRGGQGRSSTSSRSRIPATPIPTRRSPTLIDATIGSPATAFYDSSGKQRPRPAGPVRERGRTRRRHPALRAVGARGRRFAATGSAAARAIEGA